MHPLGRLLSQTFIYAKRMEGNMGNGSNSLDDIRRTSEGLFFLLEELDMNINEMTEEKKEALIGLAFEQSGKIATFIYHEWVKNTEG